MAIAYERGPWRPNLELYRIGTTQVCGAKWWVFDGNRIGAWTLATEGGGGGDEPRRTNHDENKEVRALEHSCARE